MTVGNDHIVLVLSLSYTLNPLRFFPEFTPFWFVLMRINSAYYVEQKVDSFIFSFILSFKLIKTHNKIFVNR